MTDEGKKRLSFEVPEEQYDRLWDLKNELHPDEGEAIDHAEMFERLLDRFEGKRRERPDTLPGVTARVEAPHGKVYVNINTDKAGRPFEVFITTGASGGFTKAFSEALAKSLSNALRAGVDPEVLAGDLFGIRGPGVSNDNGDRVYSVPDAVGIAMIRFLEGKLDPPRPVRGEGEPELGVED